jgi:serine/threonine-protein kinase
MIGQTFGHYRIVEKVGEGGMGAVYRATDEMLDRDVALKMLRPELAHRPATVDRFRAEAVTLAKLDHPSIARIHGFSRHETHWFIAMEFVAGDTLLARLARTGRIAWTQVVPLAVQLLDALEYAHGMGVVHRDVKPANLLLRPDGRLKVTDFGIARVLGSARATQTGYLVGTLEYMSPEQIRGEAVDGRADLYAVGILLYELLTGRVPFSGTTDYDIMTQHLQAPVPSPRPLAGDVPVWFDEIIERALAKPLANRFGSAAEFREALEISAASEPAMTVRPTRLVVPGSPHYPAGTFTPPHGTRALDAPAPASAAGGAASPGWQGGGNPNPSFAASDVAKHASAAPYAAVPGAPVATRLASSASTAAPRRTGDAPVLPSPSQPQSQPQPRATMLSAMPAVGALTWRQITAGAALVVMIVAVPFIALRLMRGPAAIANAASTTTAANANGRPPRATESSLVVGGPGRAPLESSPLPSGPIEVGPFPPSGAPPSGGGPPSNYGPPRSVPSPIAGPPRSSAPSAPRGGSPVPIAPPVESGPPAASEAADIPPVNETRRSALAPVEFEDVVMQEGKESREVLMRFEADRIVLKDADSEQVVRVLPYGRITAATYARSRNPVWKTDRKNSGLVRGLSKSVSFLRSTKHWLTLEGTGAALVLQLDGDEFETILPALEARTGVHIERVVEK